MKKILSILCFLAVLVSCMALGGCSFVSESTNSESASESQSNGVRYTVTEDEWDSWVTYQNYTIEQYNEKYHLVHKYTEYAFTAGDTIIIVKGDQEYQLEKRASGYFAFNCTEYDYWHDGLLSGGYVYDEFTYDEVICAYVLDLMEEMGARWEVKFENGVPVSIILIEVTVVDGVQKTSVLTSLYTNVGTTVIDLPEYVLEEERNPRRTVTEEEWNSCINVGNFAGNFTSIIDIDNYEFYYCSFKYTGNALMLDGNIIVFEGDKKYVLGEINGAWYATEWNEYEICPTLIPSDFKFEDFEYHDQTGRYIQKVNTGLDLYYSFAFEDGVLVLIGVQKSYDQEDPGYWDAFHFSIDEIGTVETIEVPEYVIVESVSDPKAEEYEKALTLLANCDYEGAKEAFEKLGDYRDAKEYLSKFYYMPISFEYDLVDKKGTNDVAYNSQNLPISETIIRSDAQGVSKFAYDDKGNIIEQIMIKNTEGEPEISRYVYTYNENGYLSTANYTGYDGYVASYTFLYDDKGNNVKQIYEDEYNTYEYLMTYDENGNMLSQVLVYNGEVESMNIVATYNESGKVIKEVCTYYDGSQESKDYTYDANGKCIQVVFTDENGENVYEYTYDEHGNVIKEIYTSFDGVVEYVNTKYELVYIPYGITEGTDYFFRGLWAERL